MKRLITVTILLITLQCYSFSQDRQDNEATPVTGWDSLRSMIVYPEIAKRAGVQGYSDVEVQIDLSGSVEEVKVVGYDIFLRSIEDAVKKVKWHSGHFNGQARSTTAYFEIQFQLKQIKDMPKRKILTIESEVPLVHKDY